MDYGQASSITFNMTDRMHSMSNAILSSCGSSNAACPKTMAAALADRALTLESHTHKGGIVLVW